MIAIWPLTLLLAHGLLHPATSSQRAEVAGQNYVVQSGLFVAGALSAFAAHEAGHVVANLMMGNVPRLTPVRGLAGIPFFAIAPGLQCSATACVNEHGSPFCYGPKGKFLIVTAGFEVQHLTSEWILSSDPDLKNHRAPFRKGFLAFNVGLSLAYAVASVLHVEDSHGDAGGAAALARMPRPMMAATLVVPAILDGLRYSWPHAAWAPWASRSAKAAFLGLVMTF